MILPDAPEAPDPKATAAAQTGQNVSTAIANAYLNNVDQVTPDGTLTYKATGSQKIDNPLWKADGSGEGPQFYDIPSFKAVQRLSPHGKELKALSDATEVNLGTMARDQSAMLTDHLGRPVDLAGVPAGGDVAGLTKGLTSYVDPSSISDGDATRKRVETAMMERLNAELAGDREALRSELSNQGIKLGTEAYDRGMSEYGRNLNDARIAAILGAGQEASRVFGMDMDRARYAAGIRGQQFDENLAGYNAAEGQRAARMGETFALRNQPINEISALLSGSQVSQPNFVNTPVNRIPTTDYAGIVSNNFNNEMQAYRSKLGFASDLLGGVLKAGAAGIG